MGSGSMMASAMQTGQPRGLMGEAQQYATDSLLTTAMQQQQHPSTDLSSSSSSLHQQMQSRGRMMGLQAATGATDSSTQAFQQILGQQQSPFGSGGGAFGASQFSGLSDPTGSTWGGASLARHTGGAMNTYGGLGNSNMQQPLEGWQQMQQGSSNVNISSLVEAQQRQGHYAALSSVDQQPPVGGMLSSTNAYLQQQQQIQQQQQQQQQQMQQGAFSPLGQRQQTLGSGSIGVSESSLGSGPQRLQQQFPLQRNPPLSLQVGPQQTPGYRDVMWGAAGVTPSSTYPTATHNTAAVVKPEYTDQLIQRKTISGKKRAKTFPEKLMAAMMEHGDGDDVVGWLPDGKSFVIVSPDRFVSEVLNKVFKEAKYASFIRKLHRWGFIRLTSGTGTDCFHHPLFQQNRVDLASKISCSSKPSNPILGLPSSSSRQYDKPPSLAGVEKFIRARAAANVAAMKVPPTGGEDERKEQPPPQTAAAASPASSQVLVEEVDEDLPGQLAPV